MRQHRLKVFDAKGNRLCLYPVVYVSNASSQLEFLIISQTGKMNLVGVEYNFEEVVKLVEAKRIRTSIAINERLYIPEIFSIQASVVMPVVQEAEFLKEVEDIIRELNGLPTAIDLCREALQRFKKNRSLENKLKLRDCFKRLPAHLDIWVLPFPRKPSEITELISENSQPIG